MEFRVERVDDNATWALRQAVLRPHETVEMVAANDRLDDGPSSAAFAALAPEGVVGTVRVAPQAPPAGLLPGPDDAGGSWRLRGMATRPGLRGRGIGTAVLARALDHIADHGGGLVWCNARVPARTLYARAGFIEHGEGWDDPAIGPHVVMWRSVAPSPL